MYILKHNWLNMMINTKGVKLYVDVICKNGVHMFILRCTMNPIVAADAKEFAIIVKVFFYR